MKQYCFGVDVGGTTVKLGLFEQNGNLVEKWEVITRTENQGEGILPDITESIYKKMEEHQIEKEQVVGIGIGLPGPVTKDGVILKCVNLGWGIFNIEHVLEEMTGLPVKAANDANAAALGELWQGGGRGYRDLVMITLGTGIGGGVILDGKVIPGSNGAAGELGHMPVVENETETCSCGKKGCLEQVASATGIVKEANKLLKNTDQPSMLRNLEKVTARDVFYYAEQGDELALQVTDIFSSYLGTAIAHTASVINPEAVVIGGGVSRAGKFLLDMVEKKFQEKAFLPCRNVKFEIASLGNDAGIYGAAALILVA